MPKTILVRTLLVTLVLYATSTKATSDEEASPAAVQDAYGMLLQEVRGGNSGSNQLREMARLYELIQLAAMQARQNPDFEDVMEGGEVLPIPERLITAMQENEELVKDKRGSYMSLCHFKICNMGRKRNPYWNSWIRV